MEEEITFWIIDSGLQVTAGVISLIALAVIIFAAFKLSKITALPWKNVLLFSIVVSIILSAIEWALIDFVMEPTADYVIFTESIFLVASSILFLVGCLAILKITNHLSKNA